MRESFDYMDVWCLCVRKVQCLDLDAAPAVAPAVDAHVPLVYVRSADSHEAVAAARCAQPARDCAARPCLRGIRAGDVAARLVPAPHGNSVHVVLTRDWQLLNVPAGNQWLQPPSHGLSLDPLDMQHAPAW